MKLKVRALVAFNSTVHGLVKVGQAVNLDIQTAKMMLAANMVEYLRDDELFGEISFADDDGNTEFNWSTVNEVHERIVIVASGMSAEGFEPPPGVTVIAVNGAIEWLSRADYFFTLDMSPINIKRMFCRREGVKYYCAAPLSIGTETAPSPFIRAIKPDDMNGVTLLKRIECTDKRRNDIGLSDDPSEIRSGNSAFGALGLAYHMKAEKILLIGVDGDRKRVEGGLTSDLSHLPKLFHSTVDQVGDRVKLGNKRSRVVCFDRVTRDEGVKWLIE